MIWSNFTPGRKKLVLCATAIATLAMCNVPDASNALDGPQSSQPAEVQSPSQPPTFRVQPTLRDLPPDVARNETKRTKAQIDFDKTLRICQDC